jgi:glyoxylase-like metal-dependent hydrolase (beta-lactamase superfamily II)
MALREIVPDVLRWTWYSDRHGYDFNGYLVRHGGGNVCIDPVQASEEVLAALAAEGVAHIVVTNRNHSRASMAVRERTAAPIAIHPADAAYARAQGMVADSELRPGTSVGPFTVVAAAGKSPGEVALYWPERRLLVVGDACVGWPPGALKLLPESVIDDLPALQASLAHLTRNYPVDTLLPGDGEPIIRGAGEALRRLVESFGQR